MIKINGMKSIKSTLNGMKRKVKLLILKMKNIERPQEIALFITKIDLIIYMLIFNYCIQVIKNIKFIKEVERLFAILG